jgi:phage tail-like protein
MGNIFSQPVQYLPAHRFVVQFDGQTVGQFEEAEGFDDFEIGVLEINTGDTNVVAAQSAGKKKYKPLKLTKGAIPADQDQLRTWADQIVDASGQNGDVDPNYKKNVTVQQLDRDGSPVMTYTCFEAFISSWSGGKFDAKSNEYRRVSLELTYRYNQVVPAI